MEETSETESTDLLITPKITTAQLREAVQRALAAIETVRAHIQTNRLHHAKEDFFNSALWMIAGPLYIVELGVADEEETRRLEHEIGWVQIKITSALELAEGFHQQRPIDLLLGFLSMLEEMLSSALAERQNRVAIADSSQEADHEQQ